MASVEFDPVHKPAAAAVIPIAAGDMMPLAPSLDSPAHSTGGVIVASLSNWSTGLFQCRDEFSTFVEGVFCPYCQLSRQYNTLTTTQTDIDPATCLGAMGADAMASAIIGFGLGSFMFTYIMRNRLRQRYTIAGDELEDMCISAFCRPCSVAQTHREMSRRGEWPNGTCVDQQTAHAPAAGVPVE
jgi:Cys-rich protein (TIGR01571 family)